MSIWYLPPDVNYEHDIIWKWQKKRVVIYAFEELYVFSGQPPNVGDSYAMSTLTTSSGNAQWA